MIIKNIFHKIKIHPFFYIVTFIIFLTGYFKYFTLFMLFVIIHELGHIIIALLYKWNIEKILILPFGAITFFNEKINKPLLEEFLISIFGIIFQLIFYFFINIYINDLIIDKINIFLLLFSIIPIYPLDGSKIINIIFNKFFSFQFSHKLSIILSILLIINFIFIYKNNLFLILSFIFLIKNIIYEIKNHKYIIKKFLLERYIYYFNFKKIKKIKKIKQMKRDYNHIINNKKERKILSKLFDNK